MATQPPSNPFRQFQQIKPAAAPIDNAVSPFGGAYGPVQQTDPSTQSSLQKALQFLGTPGGQAVTGLAGQGLSAYGAYQQNQQQQQQSANQFAATSAQNQFNADRTDANQKATGVLNADPLGADNRFAQKNALNAAILPNLRNAHSTPGDSGVASAMGSRTGGISNILPEGGLDPAMIQSMFGPQATMGAITQRHQEINSLDPNAAQPNLSTMFNSADAAPYQAQMKDWASKLQTATAEQRSAYDAQMKGYIDHMVEQESNTGGFWHKFAQIAGVVGAAAATIMTAGAAAPLTGMALAGMAGLGAASGAATAWGSGSSPLMGAIGGGTGPFVANAGKR